MGDGGRVHGEEPHQARLQREHPNHDHTQRGGLQVPHGAGGAAFHRPQGAGRGHRVHKVPR